MMRIINKRKYFYVFSGTLVAASLVVLAIWGLRFGIDFTGGTEMDVAFSKTTPTVFQMSGALKDLKLDGLTIQPASNNQAMLQYMSASDQTNAEVFAAVQKLDPNAKQLSVDFIGSSVSSQLKTSAVEAIVLAVIGIALYIAWAFRKVSRPVASWKYGLGAVIALAHDIMITTGVFVILGHFYNIEVGVPFIAALLTILGYSVNDTIVVFDRTRENLMRSSGKEDFEDVVDWSLNQTLARSINTSMTVILVLLVLTLFGGASIQDFSLALLIGVTFGTYSSIYVASALLVTIYKFQVAKK
jgi:preprotein translocase subunit SecF